ncbi:MAG: hypothetical protein J6M05_02845 [Cardiobacteriaceae bacterium]|nr:hypothetical protein [Cardiobacteriaceae bacterium]
MKRFVFFLLGLISFLYPFFWYFGREKFFTLLAIIMACLWFIRGIYVQIFGQKIIAFSLSLFFTLLLFFRQQNAMYFYPILVNFLFFLLFFSSLFREETMIEKLAKIQNPNLPQEGIIYTRKVTKIWCVFFVINAAVAGLLAIFEFYQLWAIYTGIISYLLIGILLASEYLYRKFYLRIN